MNESPDKLITSILLSPDVPNHGLKRVELRKKCEEKFAKRTFDRALIRLTKQGTIEKIKDPNKGNNSTTRYKIAIDPNIAEQYKKIIFAISDFNKLLKIKKLSNAKILAGCSYIIELYSVFYQHAIRVLLFQSKGNLIYDILLDKLKEQLYEFRDLFSKRFPSQRNKDKFFDELRVLASTNHIHAITKLRRTILVTVRPRTIEEVLLDHRQPLLEQIPWVEFSKVRPHLQYSKSEEFSDKELQNMMKKSLELIDKNAGDMVKHISILRVLLQGEFDHVLGSDDFNKNNKIVDGIKKSDAIIDDFIEEEPDRKASSFLELLNLGLPDEYTAGKK